MTVVLSLITIILAQTALLAYLLIKNNKTENIGNAQETNDLEEISDYVQTSISNIMSVLKRLENRIQMHESDSVHDITPVNMRLEAFQELSEDILELINAQTSAIQELEERLAQEDVIITNLQETVQEVTMSSNGATEVVSEATNIITNMAPVRPYVEPSGVNAVNPENTNNVDPTEPNLKPARQDGDPLITDLRATPFEEAGDPYGNIHDLPTAGDGYELWESGGRAGGAPGANRQNRRGFRRI